jgi:hypothetical protein
MRRPYGSLLPFKSAFEGQSVQTMKMPHTATASTSPMQIREDATL